MESRDIAPGLPWAAILRAQATAKGAVGREWEMQGDALKKRGAIGSLGKGGGYRVLEQKYSLGSGHWPLI